MNLKEILRDNDCDFLQNSEKKTPKLDYHNKMSDWFPSKIASKELAPIHIIDKMQNIKYEDK